MLTNTSVTTASPWQDCLYQEEMILDKQSEFEDDEETDNMLHTEHCPLWVRNTEITENRKEKLQF